MNSELQLIHTPIEEEQERPEDLKIDSHQFTIDMTEKSAVAGDGPEDPKLDERVILFSNAVGLEEYLEANLKEVTQKGGVQR